MKTKAEIERDMLMWVYWFLRRAFCLRNMRREYYHDANGEYHCDGAYCLDSNVRG